MHSAQPATCKSDKNRLASLAAKLIAILFTLTQMQASDWQKRVAMVSVVETGPWILAPWALCCNCFQL